jgi:hypothetical protein
MKHLRQESALSANRRFWVVWSSPDTPGHVTEARWPSNPRTRLPDLNHDKREHCNRRQLRRCRALC